MTQRYLTVPEAAAYIGCTIVAMRQRVKRGTIPFIRDRGTIRFDVNDIDRYMAARRVRLGKKP